MFDSKGKLEKKNDSRCNNQSFLFCSESNGTDESDNEWFYQLLLSLEQELPAFERELYYQNGQWYKEAQFNRSQQEIYDEYQLIQYDIVAGKQYSLADGFFEHE